MAGLFGVLYAVFRMGVEFFRVPDAQLGYLFAGWVTMGQILCLPLLLAGAWLLLRFDVAERYTAARVTADNGEVWTDSCVEFFLSPDGRKYYNFETTCIGRMLLAARTSRHDADPAGPEVLAQVKRCTTLPFGEPFEEREGDNRWSLTLAIPPQALFRHEITDWSGLRARMNLYKCGDRLSHPHFLSWQPIRTEKPDFHRPEFFGEVTFAE